MAEFPYAMAEDRQLTPTERDLVEHLLAAENVAPLYDVGSLHVWGRCGCGVCPTVMFLPDALRADGARSLVIADYIGESANGQSVGVVLRAIDGALSELEAWSPCGEAVSEWPSRASLVRFGARSV